MARPPSWSIADEHIRMKRLLLCAACAIAMLIVAIAVVFAVGIELCQAEKRREWREAMAQ
jgi:hypothetical protein